MIFWMRRLVAALLLGGAIVGIEIAGARDTQLGVVIAIAAAASGILLIVSAVQFVVPAVRARRERRSAERAPQLVLVEG